MDDGLDLVEKADRITHDLQLNGKIDIEAGLTNTYDKNFLQVKLHGTMCVIKF